MKKKKPVCCYVNGLHLYNAFIQSAVQLRLAAMQGTNQLVSRNWGLGVLLRDTLTRPGWDRTGNPLTARRQLLPPEPHPIHTALETSLQSTLSGYNIVGRVILRLKKQKNEQAHPTKPNLYMFRLEKQCTFIHSTVRYTTL